MKSIIAFSVVCLASLPCLAQCIHHGRGTGVCCPTEGCCPECKTEANEKSCFCVECEKICVPAVKFPWESCCVRKPGKIKVVRKLTKKDYECGKKVVWEWPAPEKVPCCQAGHGCGCNRCARCCDTGCAVEGECASTDCAAVIAPVPLEVPADPMGPTPAAETPTAQEVSPPLPPVSNLYRKAQGMFRMDF